MSFPPFSPKKSVVLNKPLDWANQFALSEQLKQVGIDVDALNAGNATFVLPVDPYVNTASITPGTASCRMPVSITDALSPGNRAQVNSVPATAAASTALITGSVYSDGNLPRTPDVFKQAIINSGSGVNDVTVWTPAAGKKFRLMGMFLNVSKDVAAASAYTLVPTDGATIFMRIDLSAGALVATGTQTPMAINFPANGYLSAAANNVFKIGVGGTALTAGAISVNAWGTEE